MNIDLPLPGTRLGSYQVKEQQQVTELNLTAITLCHEPTGARLLHIACDDPNNVFAVGFRTPPPDSTGIAHILEHTVLCGSQKYPVRDPFFAMLKRSLNTFMNALTAADWTLYPVASMNRKDYYNLMEIYLDATFFPLLQEQDFLQEGHRLDFSDPKDPSSLMIKGVVFNEMKGAMADPSSLLGRRLNSILFPTTCYGYNSGGEPVDIPDLTWEQLKAFHRSYYHPSNSWIFTYGNLPLEDHLQKIDELALSRFERQEVNSVIPPETRVSSPIRTSRTFPIGDDDNMEQASMVQMAWLTCPIEDTFERAATGILSSLLLGNPAAPLYQALIESGLGRNLSPGTGYHDDYRDTFIACGLQGTDPDKVDTIESLVMSTLEEIAAKGFPQERVDAALHQYEFSSREVTGDQYPYGLGLMMRLFGPWLHDDNPLSTLMVGENLQQLKNAASDPTFFPQMIKRHLLDNPHRVTLLLRPDKDHSRAEDNVFKERLETIQNHLDQEDIKQILKANKDLQLSQETPDDTSCLPILDIADIDKNEQETSFSLESISGCECYCFPQPTNGITYLNLQFIIDDLDASLKPYIPVFCALLPQIGAAGNDYLAMSRRITAATGGIRLSTNFLENPFELDSSQAVIELKGKVLDRNHAVFCEILADMLSAPDFSDLDRLKTVIGQVRTSMENSVPGAGHSFAARAASATLTPTAAQREQWSGMTQARIIRDMTNLDGHRLKDLSESFQAIADQLFCLKNLAISVAAEETALNSFRSPLKEMIEKLPETAITSSGQAAPFVPKSSATGWQFNLPVAYVARVFRTVPYTHPDSATMLVLAKLLRADFLHREIREKGGAYGGMAAYNTDGGLFSMLSYRDPHLARTLDVYKQGITWLCEETFSEETIREAILTTFADLDRPLSPGSRGYREFLHQRQGITHDMIQQFRSRILETDQKKLTDAARIYLQDGYASSSVGILAGEDMFEQASAVVSQMGMQINRLG